ncbi:MAG: hypothetical protein IKU97_02170 [Tidjanibacter sp.]|nr:hypothetical protein [Tidjanibacter sp.]
MKKIVSIIICLASALPLSSCQEDRFVLPAEKDEHGMSINPYLDNLWASVKANEAGLDTWDILQFLLEASDLGWDQKYIKVALTNLSNEQVRIEGDPYYGQNARYVAGTHTDRNNVQFSLQLATLLKMHYWDTLNEENKALLDEFLDYAVYACVDYTDIAVTYSNIYLMKTWNLIALGENLPADRTWGKTKQKTPAELAEEGYQMFRTWWAYTKANGIHEHNSPTYTGVQAECLGYIAKYTKNEEIHYESNLALEYLSAMMFANYFTPAMTLGGVQSRCYYKGASGGKIDNIMGGLVKGWGTHFYNTLAIWEPTEQARTINDTYPRTVCYKWGTDEDMNAIGYYEKKFNISSTGRPYTGNANEKTMTIFLTSDKRKSIINVVHYMDGRQDPYGKAKVGSAGVARHLQKYALGRAQRNNEFVTIMASDGSERNDTKVLQSHVLLPSNYIDEVWMGNTREEDWLSLGTKVLPAADNYTFFIRVEDVVVSIRYIYTQTVQGKIASPKLCIDTDGTQVFSTYGNAMRITTDLSTGTPTKWQRGTVAMWWRADSGIDTDEKFTALREAVINAPASVVDDGENLSVCVTTPDGDLGVEGKLIRKTFPQAVTVSVPSTDATEFWGFEQTRLIGGCDPAGVHFSVNGEDISGPIFDKSNL